MSMSVNLQIPDPEKEIRSLVDVLVDTERRLEILTAGEVDAVADSQGRTFLLRRAQDQLRESEARKETAILNALPANVAMLDAHGIIISVNDGWRSFAADNGLDDANFALGQNYLEVSKRADGKFGVEGHQVAAGIGSVLNGEANGYSVEYPCHSANHKRWFLLRVNPVQQGPLRGAVVMHVDMTARRLTEAALRESEERFRGTFEQAAVGMAHISREGKFLRVNTKLCELTGYSREELLSLPIAELMCSNDEADCQDTLHALLAGERGSYVQEKPYVRKDGQSVWVNVMSTAKRSADGVADGFITVVNDITTRKRSEYRLHRLNRLHRVLSRIGEAIVRTPERQELFEKVCRLLIDDGQLKMAVIALVNEGEKTVRFAAAYGEGLAYLSEAIVTTEGPHSLGTVGTAIRTGKHDWCNDIASESRMVPWQKLAAKYGLASNASFPLKLKDVTIGAVLLYSGEVDYFHDDELGLMSAVVNELSFALEVQEKDQERERVALALRTSEANMTVAQGIAHFGSWEMDLADESKDNDLGSLRWSEEMFRIAGFDPAQAPAVTPNLFFSLVHPDDRAPIQEAMACAIKTGERYSITHRLIRPNGEERVLQEAARVFFHPKTGRPYKVIGTAHDITDRKKAEEALKSSEQEYRELAQQLQSERARLLAAQMVGRVGSWETNLSTMIAEWSDETHRIFQTEPGSFDASHTEFLKLVHPEDRSMVEESFLKSLSDRNLHSIEHRILLPDGRVKFVEERWQIFEGDDAKPSRAVGTCQDITDRKKLESQFLRVQRMESIGTLASGIAHDLNNVLAPILMSLEMLEDQVSNDEGRTLIGILQNSAQRGADLVKQVLTFAKGVEGQRVVANLIHIVLEIQKIARDTFPKNINFRVNFDKELWHTTGDPTQLHQVFMNLCVNARDAMPAGGNLTVTLENIVLDEVYSGLTADAKAGSYVIVSVADSGQGIPPDIRDKVFDPFFTTKETGQGTGLGLSTTLAIVKSHHGFIHLYSELGKGTTFKVYIPASKLHNPANVQPAVETAHPRGNGELLLLADDEEAVRTVAKKTLERFGYRVLIACNGAEAVGIYAQHRGEVALVITDMAMPIMDGAATVVALRALNPDVKIIASSGVASNGGVVKALGLGVEHFVSKPYTAEILLGLIHRALIRTTPKVVPNAGPLVG